VNKIIHSTDKKFPELLRSLLAGSMEFDPSIMDTVSHIIQNVRAKGDQAVAEYTKQFDGHTSLKVGSEEIAAAKAIHPPGSELYQALELAARRISAYHYEQMPRPLDYVDPSNVRLGNLWRPLASVGMYVPGGLASYPSSVLMNAIPAQVAGVKRLVMMVPAPNNQLDPSLLVAADMLGIQEIFKVGGAQAIAALAYGTKTIPAVDKIVGPGNAYVAAAKRQVFGQVGIDMVAGPSEIVVVSDAKTPAAWVAADLLSQAEHDVNARSLLITDDEKWAKHVLKEISTQIDHLDRKEIAQESWDKRGAVIIVNNLEQEAIEVINIIAPEHLELALDEVRAEKMLPFIQHAGAIFVGRYTPEAIGDYVAGPSHVLPTAGTARFSSGLSVYDFLKRISLISCPKDAFGSLAHGTKILADNERLGAHALSVTIRQTLLP
jgi:histidinol dehydrogenase